MASIALLLYRAAPGAPAIIVAGFTGVTGLAALALAFTLDDAALFKFTSAVAAAAGIVVLCALVGPDARLGLASFASATFGVGLAVWLARTARARPKVSWPLIALFAVTLALLSAYAATLVLVSRDLMIADFMTYRGLAMMVARLADAGAWPVLLSAAVQSVTQDYSWAPALVPGLVLALMILPTVTAISREVIVAIGTDLREASMSLGATKWETVARVVLPASRIASIASHIPARVIPWEFVDVIEVDPARRVRLGQAAQPGHGGVTGPERGTLPARL